MWKYVARRIRDVYDRTHNVLDVRRPCQYGAERFCTTEGTQHQPCNEQFKIQFRNEYIRGSYCLLNVGNRQITVAPDGRQSNESGSNSSGRDGFRRKEFCPFQHSWIGAITWSGAIICGWYTSKLICLHRRNRKWEGPKCLPFLISSAHKIPRDFYRSHCQVNASLSVPQSPPTASNSEHQEHQATQRPTFFGVPIPTAKPSPLAEVDFGDTFVHQKDVIFPINNEPIKSSAAVPADRAHSIEQIQHEPAPTVESAMQNLVSVIGEIEYQLGVQNLEVGDYSTAVSHLKLGTSHQHAGAAFNLGICYEQGFGVKKSPRVAMECYYTAATLGHPQAMYNLGVYYAHGLGGLRRSRRMAKKYFTAAADMGLQEAIDALGANYRSRRDSLLSAGSSAGSTPAAVPFQFKFNYDELERYGYGLKNAEPQTDQIELRLVSAMA
ncbi:DAP3-binding cell death enhancer 1-like [Sabethes cyaneus]|uniref:DAP3-binding cell death enhancer 1-like n=1 Tax=Sabethes cyaneus TaxID=53552 RepID=UPI00221E2C4B|nr:DAP3-binding cell death enhancer 1-like [Sabethes cyaneus]